MNRVFLASLVVAAFPGAALAQTSELFINQYGSSGMFVAQGGSIIRSWNEVYGAENAIAVAGATVRTAGSNVFGPNGAEYDLNGVPQGPSYNIGMGGNYYDGTTDGSKYNYAVQHNGDYNVYRFDRDWANPQPLFNVGFATSGITYDSTNGTLWVSDGLSKLVRNFDLTGQELSSFTMSQGTYAYGLALDPADGTLWQGDYGNGVLHQYDKTGQHLGSISLNVSSAFGIEFNIPSPGAAVLLGLGTALAARRRR
jgi:hypothetical protein